jgi:hypothetical protein
VGSGLKGGTGSSADTLENCSVRTG